jgi:hypothetical protein
MTRALPMIAFAALASAGSGCQPTLVSDHGEPIVGRLQFSNRLVDLTVESFTDHPQAVPRSSFAEVMADIDPSAREAPMQRTPEPGLQRLDELDELDARSR